MLFGISVGTSSYFSKRNDSQNLPLCTLNEIEAYGSDKCLSTEVPRCLPA